MKIVVFGANGGTGRLLTGQALAAGHQVSAVTRRPGALPIRHHRLRVVEADAHDTAAVDRAVEATDVVLSVLGVPLTRRPVTTYSAGMYAITEAMHRHGVKRVAAVTSSAVEPYHHEDGGFLMNRILQPLITATIGRTTYADMGRMEEHLRSSGLAWTIVRPSGLFDAPGVSDYQVYEDRAPGIFTSRADLAACVLEQVTDTRFLRRTLAVTTVVGTPTLWQLMRREAFRR